MHTKKLSGRTLVLQLDREEIRIAQMNLGAAMPQISQSMTLPTPEGAVEDGVIRALDPLVDVLKPALAAPEYRRTRQVVFTLCTTQVISEQASVPALNDKKLEQLLRANVDMYFPVDVQDYNLVWRRLGLSKNGDGGMEQIVQLWAVPNGVLARYYALANACGLSVAAVDWCGNSLASAVEAGFGAGGKLARGAGAARPVRRKQGGRGEKEPQEESAAAPAQTATAVMERPDSGDTTLYFLAEAEHVLMTFVREGEVKLQRLLLRGGGGDELNEAQMVLEYYSSMDYNRFGRIQGVACGALAEDPEYVAGLERAFGVPFKVWGGLSGPGWCLCVGASRTTLDFGVPSMNQLGKVSQQLGQIWQYGLVLAGGVVLVGVVLLTLGSRTIWNTTLNGLQSTQRSLMLQAAENEGNAQRYNDYAAQYDNYSADWETLFGSLRTYNDNLVRMLSELETILPSGVSVINMGAADEGLGLQFACDTKEEAAHLLISLRKLQYATLDAVSKVTLNAQEGPSGQDMLPSLAAKLEAEEQARLEAAQQAGQGEAGEQGEGGIEPPPTEGSMFEGISDDLLDQLFSSGTFSKEDLEKALENLTPEQIAALEEAYGVKPSTTYSLETLLKQATFEQRKAALETMLTSDPIAMYQFFVVFQEDVDRPAGTEILFGEISDDLWENRERLEDIYSGDRNAMQEMIPILLEILTKDEKTLSAAEKLIQTDGDLSNRYAYYLAVEMKLQDKQDNVGNIDMDKVIEDIKNGNQGGTGNDKVNDALDSLIDGVTPTMDEDKFKEFLEQYMKDNLGGNGNPGGSSSNTNHNSNSGTNNPGSSGVNDALNQLLNGGGLFPNANNTGNLSGGSQQQETADGRIYFAVALGYKPALIEAELERKGLTYLDKVEKLEVAE